MLLKKFESDLIEAIKQQYVVNDDDEDSAEPETKDSGDMETKESVDMETKDSGDMETKDSVDMETKEESVDMETKDSGDMETKDSGDMETNESYLDSDDNTRMFSDDDDDYGDLDIASITKEKNEFSPVESMEDNSEGYDRDSDFIPESCSSDTDNEEIIPLSSGDVADAGSVLICERTDKEPETSTDVGKVKSPNNQEMYKHNKRHLYKNITVAGYERLNGKRNYSKPDFCLFCKNEYKSKMSKHLVAVHLDEARMREVIDEPIHSKKRKLLLLKLQNEGNYQHNIEVLKKGKGVLIVKRRPNMKNSNNAIDYVPCEFCLAFVKDDSLWIHSKSCPLKPGNCDGNFLRNGRIMLQSVLHTPETDDDLVDLFSRFKETIKNPGLKQICEKDELICSFASNLLDKLGTEDEQRRKDKDNVRTKVRSVGRLLKKLNEKKFRDFTLNSFICGREFATVVNTVKELSVECNSPNLALTLGHYLKQICLLKISLAIERGNPSMKQDATDFQQLYNAHWNSRVSAVVLRRLRLRQINKKIELPSTEDLITLKAFLTTELNKGLDFQPSLEDWIKFAEMLITRIVLFNKRRISEVEELKVVDFDKRLCGSSASEELSRLDTAEKVLAKRMDLIEVRGKSTRGLRKVFVLLEPDMVRGIESLMASRLYVGINPLNKYIFGRASLGPLDGCTAMRNTVNMCPGLEKPNRIRSTMLRRYLATVSQLLDMTGDELKMVADHMGHSIAIHTDIYRTMTSTLERTKVARALIALENGTLHKFQGRNLDSIDIEEIPMSDGENVDPDNERDDGNEISEKEDTDHLEMKNDKVEDTETTCTAKVKRKRWSPEEERAINNVFGNNIAKKINVSSEDIRKAKDLFPVLIDRSNAIIRSKMNNIILGKDKKFKRE